MIGFIFLIACVIQIFLLVKKEELGLIFYLSIIPLDYFSILSFITLDFTRVCGLVIILFYIIKHPSKILSFFKHPIILFFFYLTGSSITQYFLFDFNNSALARLSIQLFNYSVYLFTAWIIRETFYSNDLVELIKKYIPKIIIFHLIVSSYQLLSYLINIPKISIRNFGHANEQIYPSFALMGIEISRIFSFLKEPKHFGALLTIFIGGLLLFNRYLQIKTKNLLIIFLCVALFLTFSTSAWIVFCLFIVIYLTLSLKKNAINLILIILLSISLVFLYLNTTFFQNIMQARVIERLNNPLGDYAEEYTKIILSENPIYYLFGTGLGRMSFLISEATNNHEYVFMPNFGLLMLICDIGIFGIILELIIIARGLRYLFSKNMALRNASIFCLLLFIQYLVFQPAWVVIYLFSTALIISKGHKTLIQSI